MRAGSTVQLIHPHGLLLQRHCVSKGSINLCKIRMATPDDAPALQAIYAPFVAATVISFEAVPPTVEEMAGRIAKVLEQYPWLVAVDAGGAPVGYAYATQHRARMAYQWSVDVSVYVDPRVQRRRIGRGLYTALFVLLRGQGYINAYAGIALPNPASVGLHTALGFEPVGVYRQVGYKLGAWHDVGWWTLRLAAPPRDPDPPQPIGNLAGTPVWDAALTQGMAAWQG